MASTNKTTHYNLPLFVGTDKPTWLGDFNSAMQALDAAIYEAEQAATAAQSQATSANATATSANSNATTAISNASQALTIASGQPTTIGKTLTENSFGGATISSFNGEIAFNTNGNLAQLFLSIAVTGTINEGSTVIARVPGYSADSNVKIGLVFLQYTTSTGSQTDVYTAQLKTNGNIAVTLNYRQLTGTAYVSCYGLVDISRANATIS